MRDLSTSARIAINSQETEEVFLLLLTVDHSTLENPLYFVQNNENIVSRGNTHIAYPFEINLPDSIGDSLPQVTLSIDNVSREIVDAVRNMDDAPSISLEVVLASSPDTVEVGPFPLTVKTVDYDAMKVEFLLTFEESLLDGFPAQRFTPDLYPGLF